MNLVVDASVVVKWTLPDPAEEPDTDRALALLGEIRSGNAAPLQPAHWLAETAAVITRLRPDTAQDVIDLLDAMEFSIIDDVAIYKRASRVGAALDHHLFDTLYHAVALEWEIDLITADDHYYRKAEPVGRILRLADWAPTAGGRLKVAPRSIIRSASTAGSTTSPGPQAETTANVGWQRPRERKLRFSGAVTTPMSPSCAQWRVFSQKGSVCPDVVA